MGICTFLEHLYQLTRIPICIYSEEGTFKSSYPSGREGREFFQAEEVKERLQLSEKNDVLFYQYQKVPAALIACKRENVWILAGPVAIGRTDAKKPVGMMEKQFQALPAVQLKDLLLTAVLILNEDSEKRYTLEMLVEKIQDRPLQIQENVLDAELRQYDSFQKNHTYAEEQAFFEHIRNGDVQYIREKYEVITPPHPMVVNNLQKNEEYMAVIEISMAARSAIEGGITSREALLMNDIYLQHLAECDTVEQIFALKKEACLEFARVVKEGKETQGENPYIEDCKKDIYSRKREKIDLQKIADDIGISKEYMLKLFKKQEGIAMTEYILRVKLEAACNMLKFSDRKIGEISDYLSFGSLNYFSRIFAKRMGMSPKEYRKLHHQPNF